MKILILDDDLIRHKTFARRFAGHEVVHHTSFEKFCDDLTKKWDLIHLDHDLGDLTTENSYFTMYGSQKAYDGVDAACAVARMSDKPTRVVVHSWNPAGARRMVAVLKDAEIPTIYEPFDSEPETLEGVKIDE